MFLFHWTKEQSVCQSLKPEKGLFLRVFWWVAVNLMPSWQVILAGKPHTGLGDLGALTQPCPAGMSLAP